MSEEEDDVVELKNILHLELPSVIENPEDDTVCSICYAEFLDAEDLNTHFMQVHLNERRKLRFCTICNKLFSDISLYAKHFEQEHLRCLHCCKFCYRFFITAKSKNQHEKSHAIENGMKCSQCNSNFLYSVDLTEHEFDNHRNSEGIMVNQCFETFCSLLCMNPWRFLKGYGENVKFMCMNCSMTTYDMAYYLSHLQKNSCQCLFSCVACYNVYSIKKSLIKHQCRGKYQNSTAKCNKCNKIITHDNIQSHQDSCGMVRCNVCGLLFHSVKDLAKHNTESHPEQATVHQCMFCDRQTIGKDILKKHIRRVHKGKLHLYKYKCVYCDHLFMHPRKLFGHFYTMHKQLEPYTCKICDKSFRVRKRFTLHVKMSHASQGFVEFDKNYNVFFSDKRSEDPFKPTSFYSPLSDSEEETRIEITIEKETPHKSDEKFDITDTDYTEPNDKNTKRKSNKIKHKTKIRETVVDIDSSEEENMSLLKIRNNKRIRLRKKKKSKKRDLTCPQCYKNCYTLLNYEHHMSLHTKGVEKRCIKCNETFKSKSALDKHITDLHSSSTLVDTLKKVLEKRKNAILPQKESSHQKFLRTLKKVEIIPEETQATITRVTSNAKISVRKFLENFIPESQDTIKIKDSLTIKLSKEERPPFIKVYKCKTDTEFQKSSLKMPVKFKDDTVDNTKVTVNLITSDLQRAKLNYGEKLCNNYYATHKNFSEDHSYCNQMNQTKLEEEPEQISDDDTVYEEPIPEIAEEVMLASGEMPTKATTANLHNMPRHIETSTMSYKIKIGTLIPQAPYYKIMTVDDMLESEKKDQKVKDEVVTLPNGTKLVQVNPLQHLLDENVQRKLKNVADSTKKLNICEAIAKSLVPPKKKKLDPSKLT
ncbi:unnamed protein product [Leptidea sinapis]|uniref:C2H2-type domain-containing protein n=1 Tax=Leptidea sinapis TaxID=189913 RepID=A0A5E4QQX1_9NEOP|nr:unnamed protein product [Leptidea sinapis]